MNPSSCSLTSKLFVLIAVLGIAGPVFSQSGNSDVRQKIIGTWRAVSSENTLKDGSKRPDPVLGPHGKGFLMYSADGYMCAELMNPDRPAWKDLAKPTDAEKISSFDGFFGYCGRYEVDEAKHTIYHLPEVSMTQDYPGTRQVRPYRFDGDRLVLGDKVTDDPEIVAWQIVWEKVK